MAEKWVVASPRDLVEAHVSDYESSSDALYEYIKNMEDAGAKVIHTDFDYKANTVLVYGDGKGLTAPELDTMRVSVGKSNKGSSHHGLGIMAFMRFGQELFIFSKNKIDGKINVISCRGEDDDILSDIGSAREVGDDEQAYYHQYSKLNRWEEGTVCLIKGVGRYKSHKFDWRFEMETEFGKFEKWFQIKAGFSLKERSYFVKFGDDKAKKLDAKLGQGPREHFFVPSKDHPLSEIPGKRNTFEFNGRTFELTVEFDFYLSPSNNGVIRISESRQNSMDIKEAFKTQKIASSSVYKNPEYTKYLTGHIDFKIKPLDKGESINVYSGSRSALMVDGDFGNVLANIMIYADVSKIRPAILSKQDNSRSKRDEMRSRELQASMEALFRDNKTFASSLIHQQNVDMVPLHYVKCPVCKLTVQPKKGATASFTITKGNIYQPSDQTVYVCGSCGNRWERRQHVVESHQNTQPQYKKPTQGPVGPRTRTHGFGYTFVVTPFDRNDTRRYAVVESTVKLNRDHIDYRSIENSKGREALALYEHQLALNAIIRHEGQEFSREQLFKAMEDSISTVCSWFYTRRKRVTITEAQEAREEDVKTALAVNTATTLAGAWGAKVSS